VGVLKNMTQDTKPQEFGKSGALIFLLKMSVPVFSVLLMWCFSSSALFAQETGGRVMPVSETKQEASRGITLGERSSVTAYPLRSGLETQPFPVATPVKIVYPKKAIRKGWEGQTVVAAEVLPDGSVGKTALAKSSGHEVLDNAAQNAIETWKFGTESEKDEAVPQYVDIPVTFKLQEEERS